MTDFKEYSDLNTAFRDTPGGGLEVMNRGVWTHVPDAAASYIRFLQSQRKNLKQCLAECDVANEILMQALKPFKLMAEQMRPADRASISFDIMDDAYDAFEMCRKKRVIIDPEAGK